MKFLCDNENKLTEVAEKVLDLSKNNKQGAFVVGLIGDLGSGKTAFTKKIAELLGVTETVTSPTYVIQKNFNINRDDVDFKKLFHLDVYRLESEGELGAIGWQEMIEDPKNIVIVEWPEIVAKALPEDILKMKFTFIDENTREVEIIEK